MPAVKGDGMRGLAVFISDIRNCKSKEAELKRINRELANIRSKFKGFCFISLFIIFSFCAKNRSVVGMLASSVKVKSLSTMCLNVQYYRNTRNIFITC